MITDITHSLPMQKFNHNNWDLLIGYLPTHILPGRFDVIELDISSYPILHMQSKCPYVFTHFAFLSQRLFVSSAHSSSSTIV